MIHTEILLSSLLPVSLLTLERAYDIGKEEGLDFVYVGDVLGHPYQ
jgi:pyruvate-formate lyase-activating enzyme